MCHDQVQELRIDLYVSWSGHNCQEPQTLHARPQIVCLQLERKVISGKLFISTNPTASKSFYQPLPAIILFGHSQLQGHLVLARVCGTNNWPAAGEKSQTFNEAGMRRGHLEEVISGKTILQKYNSPLKKYTSPQAHSPQKYASKV